MKVRYLRSARADLRWWRMYYGRVFPQGAARASERYLTTVLLLQQHPELGRVIEGRDVRRLMIPNTRFLIVYRIRDNAIEIVRVWDTRQKPLYGTTREDME